MIDVPEFLYQMKPLRNGSSWEGINAVIEDKTLSGKTKRRLSHSQSKKPFAVKFKFTYEQYCEFKNWWENDCLFGLQSFGFPEIDSINGGKKEYRVVAGATPKYSNPSGDYIECTMNWEEV